MPADKTCIVPTCDRGALTKMDLESSWTTEKFFCAKCGRIYLVPTTIGKVTQVAPLALIGGFAISVLTGDAEQAMEHAAELLN